MNCYDLKASGLLDVEVCLDPWVREGQIKRRKSFTVSFIELLYIYETETWSHRAVGGGGGGVEEEEGAAETRAIFVQR